MSKKILGLDLGSNSIGWALLEGENNELQQIIDIGCRIFIKAVEDKTPTPKNMKRRQARLARRVIQRRARRKQRMLNYLVSLDLLPSTLQGHTQPETILNELGDPYQLRAKSLDEALSSHELGRVFLHLVQRRGFLSNRKTLLGDMINDPDVLATLDELDEKDDQSGEEEKEFKQDISQLRQTIRERGCRTLGEYLSCIQSPESKRNRKRNGGHLRTDRQMYREELDLIWNEQKKHHAILTTAVKEQIEEIIFKQRPLKLKDDRVGSCSLEPGRKRVQIARLEYQKFRYLQDINNLKYLDNYTDTWNRLTENHRKALIELFDNKKNITFPQIRKTLGFDRSVEFNLEHGNKKLKGNITACTLRKVLPEWDEMPEEEQLNLLEDLLTIKKKSALKKRLMKHWDFDLRTTIDLCLLEFEPGHGNLSLRAIRKLLPFLEQGQIYSDALQNAGYGYEEDKIKPVKKLGPPPETANPIVNKALHELRRVINALIAEYGKPDIIRVEMARDLEMNTKRYKEYLRRQNANTKANEEAVEQYRVMAGKYPHLKLSSYPSRDDKIRYRIWKDQNELCAYSGKKIPLTTLFGIEIDIDHILPYSESLDDSYMNKVVCYAKENRAKGQHTPIDAFSSNPEKWEQIKQRISRWDKGLKSKKNRFYMTAQDVQQRDFINNQLNDTRYISRLACDYLKQLGADINVTKGIMTGWLRHMWNLDSLIGEDKNRKDRTDHRHHTIDAAVTACIDRRFYQELVRLAKDLEQRTSELKKRDLHINPPWDTFRGDLNQLLSSMIVAHAPQKKLAGALHDETGVGFIDGIGTVYRADLDHGFKMTQVKNIIDDTVRDIIEKHLQEHDNNPKIAFAEDKTVYHKDGTTPIRRVRIRQSKTTLKKLAQRKLGIKDHSGKVFRWMAYGNMHHVEIIRHRKTGKYSGKFITMLEASHRARGIHMPKQPIIKTDHGDDFEFIMALHINDMIEISGKYYRVQVLDRDGGRLELRLHTAATEKNKDEQIRKSISTLMQMEMKKIAVNAIGGIISQ